jgi:hypothetical protein
MPKRRACWASWNFLGSSGDVCGGSAPCVSYWVQSLQQLPADAPNLFVTLNPPTPPKPSKVFRKLKLSHPEFSFQSWHAQDRILDIQSSRGCIFYAGAWCGYGFHEDGMRAAVAVLHALGLKEPWVARGTSPHCGWRQASQARAASRFLNSAIHKGAITVVFPWGDEGSFGSGACYQPHPCEPQSHASGQQLAKSVNREERSTTEIGNVSAAMNADGTRMEHPGQGRSAGAVTREEGLDQVPYHVVASFAHEQAPLGSTAYSAIYADVCVPSCPAEDVLVGPGPSFHNSSAIIRILEISGFCGAVFGGVDGLMHAYAQRDIEVDDLEAFCGLLLQNWRSLVAVPWGCSALLSLQHIVWPVDCAQSVLQIYQATEIAIDERGMLQHCCLGEYCSPFV